MCQKVRNKKSVNFKLVTKIINIALSKNDSDRVRFKKNLVFIGIFSLIVSLFLLLIAVNMYTVIPLIVNNNFRLSYLIISISSNISSVFLVVVGLFLFYCNREIVNNEKTIIIAKNDFLNENEKTEAK